MKKRLLFFLILFHILFVLMIGGLFYAIHDNGVRYACPFRVVMGGACVSSSQDGMALGHFFKSVWYLMDLFSVPLAFAVMIAVVFFLFALWRHEQDDGYLFAVHSHARAFCFFNRNVRRRFYRWLAMRRARLFLPCVQLRVCATVARIV